MKSTETSIVFLTVMACSCIRYSDVFLIRLNIAVIASCILLKVQCMSHTITVLIYRVVSYAVEPMELDTLLQNPMIFSQSLLPSGELVASSIQGKTTVCLRIFEFVNVSYSHKAFHTRPDQGFMNSLLISVVKCASIIKITLNFILYPTMTISDL